MISKINNTLYSIILWPIWYAYLIIILPAFLIFIPITTFMARIGAKTVHTIDKKKISKFFGIFLLVVSIKFFYEYLKL